MSTRVTVPMTRKRARQMTVLLSPLIAAACAVGPDYRPPDDAAVIPTAYSSNDVAVAPSAPVDHWWTQLGDSNLDALIQDALSGNPDLAAAEARIQQSRALARAAGADFWPSINASGRVSRDKLSRNGENLALIPFNPPTTQFTDYRVGVDASWEIDLAGRTRREVEAAVARFGSQTESRNDARVVVAAEVASAYVEYRVAAERQDLAQRTAANLAESARLIELQQRAGLASMSDLRSAEADQLAAAESPALLDASRRAALERLFALTSIPTATLEARLAAPSRIPQPPAATPIGVPATLLKRRPDVRRAERELAAATADAGVAVAAQFPRLSLTGNGGFDSVRTGDLTSAASRYWSIAPQLTLPIFAAGRLHQQSKAAEAGRQAALESYRSSVLHAIADAESAVVQYAGDRRNASSLAGAASRLEENAALQRQRYTAGDVSQVEVLAAERSANRAADQRSQSAGQSVLDFVALQKALGGGWQSSD